MELKEFIEDFRRDIQDLQLAGTDQIAVKSLLRYIDETERIAGLSESERNRQQAAALATLAATNSANLEMFKAVIEAGKSALQAVMVINGGAAVALLGMFANLAAKPEGIHLARALSQPMQYFGAGVLIAAFSFGIRYASQACFSEAEKRTDRAWKIAKYFQIIAIIFTIAGYCAFAKGIYEASNAILLQPPATTS